jgi:hypothetical protein
LVKKTALETSVLFFRWKVFSTIDKHLLLCYSL